MKIYLDSIFLENIIVNYILIYQVNIFTKSKAKVLSRVLGAGVLAIYTVATYVLQDSMLNTMWIKLLSVIIAIYITFRADQVKVLMKQILYYYIVSFLYVGVIISLTLFFHLTIDKVIVKIMIYLVGGVISYLFNQYLWKVWKRNIKKEDLTYTINIKGQEIPAFLDTGNLAHSPIHHTDIIFLDYSWYGVLELLGVLQKRVSVSIHTVSQSDETYGYLVKGVKIFKAGKEICTLDKIIFSFSNQKINIDDKYTALIGYQVYLDNLKGVTL